MVMSRSSGFEFSSDQSLSRGRVKQMDEPWIGFEPDLVARLELMSFAKHRDDVLTVFLVVSLGAFPAAELA